MAQKSKKLKADKFIALIKSGSAELSSPLIVLGKEELRAKRLVSWLLSRSFSGAETQQYFGSTLTAAKHLEPILQALQTPSLFNSLTVITVLDSDTIRKAIAEPLAAALEKPSSSVFVILLAKSINQKTPLLTRLRNSALIVELDELKGPTLERWIAKEAKQHAIKLSTPALRLLTDIYGNDCLAISQELEKLSLLSDPNQEVSAKDVEGIIFKAREHTSFELFSQIAKKNAVASLRLTEDLLNQGLHPLQLSAFLSRTFQSALVPETLNPWMKRNLSSALTNLSETRTLSALTVVRDLDLALKGSKLPPAIVLKNAVQSLAS